MGTTQPLSGAVELDVLAGTVDVVEVVVEVVDVDVVDGVVELVVVVGISRMGSSSSSTGSVVEGT
jgi:hypothetical protein